MTRKTSRNPSGAPRRAKSPDAASVAKVGEEEEEVTLVRSLGFWGSFSIGYADVGADIYIALGVVVTWAMGAAPLAFLMASILYACTGLSYAELAAAHPVAGGGAVYARKAFGNAASFIAGWGLLLDYTIDISLFAVASIGYLGYLFPILHASLLFPIAIMGYTIPVSISITGLVAAVLVSFLIILNYIGIRESAFLNTIFVVIDMIGLSIIMAIGFTMAWSWGMVVGQIQWGTEPPLGSFFYAISIAIVSFIGLESISQAAEETHEPSRIIPKTTLALIAAVILFSVGVTLLAVGVVPWQLLATSHLDPMAAFAGALPFGFLIAPIIAVIGATICYVSANTGIVGVSRVTYEMGRSGLFPRWFNRLHPKHRTPYRSIIAFSLIGIGLAFLGNLELLVDLYNFGALVNYMLVNLALIRLRNSPTEDKHPWRVRGTLRIPWRDGRVLEVPINAVIGFVSCALVWVAIVLLHFWGRLGGTLWFLIGFALYALYRKRHGLPLR
jgi:APA family basic amino acid/polyamine antiporter